VTHGVLSGNAAEILNQSNIDELIVTDTIPITEPKLSSIKNLKVLTTASMFGEAIKRIHAGLSLSELMDS